MEYNEERLEHNVFQQYGNMIDCALQLNGPDVFMMKLDERKTKPNPKYEEILRRHAAVHDFTKAWWFNSIL